MTSKFPRSSRPTIARPWLTAALITLLAGPAVEAQTIGAAPEPLPPPAPEKWKGFRIRAEPYDAEIRLSGLVQADGLFLPSDERDTNNRFEIRRSRVAIRGTIGERFGFRVEPQFFPGRVLMLDAYVDAELLGPELVLRAGRMKTPLGIEMLQPIHSLILPERGFTTELVPLRDLGAQLQGDLGDGVFEYRAGVFNGEPGGANDDRGNTDDNVDLYGRVFVQPLHHTSIAPLRKLGLGIAGSWGLERGSAQRPGLSRYQTVARSAVASYVDGVRADGVRWRINPQGWWYWGPLGVIGETVHETQRIGDGNGTELVQQFAWLAGVSVILTGENAAFGGVIPRREWGAIELSGRITELHIDEAAVDRGFLPDGAATGGRELGASLSYWPNQVIRMMLAYDRTSFDQPRSGAQPTEHAIFWRMQAAP